MDIWQKTEENLRKLRANETQMSKEQLVRYAKQLKKLRNEIIADVNVILKHFWLSSIMAEKDEQLDAVCKAIQGVVNDEAAKGEMKLLKDILFQTYSIEKFLNMAYRVSCRIRYEAYAPYWISKCSKKPLPDGIPWAGLDASGAAWYNSLIDMYWHDVYGVWVSENEKAWCVRLPPTKELCDSEYEKERRTADA